MQATLLGIASGSSTPIEARCGSGIGLLPPRLAGVVRRQLGLAMAYQDRSSIQAEPVKNNLYCAAGTGAAVPPPGDVGLSGCSADFDLDLELFP